MMYRAHMGKGGCFYFHDDKPISREEFMDALANAAADMAKRKAWQSEPHADQGGGLSEMARDR